MKKTSALTAVKLDVIPDLDPHLQKAVVRSKYGVQRSRIAPGSPHEVAVIAKVNDLNAWQSRVRGGVIIGETASNGTTITTARIPASSIEALRRERFVVSLKAARRLRPQLSKTIEATKSRADLLPIDSDTDGGSRAIIGIIDFGFDFMHENFRNADADRTSRALAIWDQNAAANETSPFGYGRLHTQQDINAALRQSDPYTALGYGPPVETPGQDGTHGTHVTDIAAGNDRGSGVPGVAPKAAIVFVELSSSELPFRGPAVVGSSFGDSVQLLEAIRFIFDQADQENRPCSINISLATNGGPHDGSTLVEQGIDRMLTDAPDRAVTIAAGNSFSDRIHASGTVSAGGAFDLIWDVPTTDSSNNELELWYGGTDRFAVEVIAPTLESVLRVEPGETQALQDDNGQTLMLVANRLDDPNNHANMIGIFLSTGLPLGQWTVRLHGVAVEDGRFHAWIERDDVGQSRFVGLPLDNACTLGSISCGHETIVVGSYDAHLAGSPLAFDSSSGPTRDGRNKPDVSAPGCDVFAARSITRTDVPHNLVTHKSGTSMAAPAVAGVIALMLSEAKGKGRPLRSEEIRQIVKTTAQRNPPPGAAFDSRYGHGRVSGADAVTKVMTLGIAARESKPRPIKPAGKRRATPSSIGISTDPPLTAKGR